MAAVDELLLSLSTDEGGVHLLLWDQKSDLVRTMLLLHASLDEIKLRAVHASSSDRDKAEMRLLADARSPLQRSSSPNYEEMCEMRDQLWVLFVPQGAARQVGPWLNGWRRPLAEPRGCLLVVREADYDSFQRGAPDLCSFIGPRIYNAAEAVSGWSPRAAMRIKPALPMKFESVLEKLPGPMPKKQEINQWIQRNNNAIRDVEG